MQDAGLEMFRLFCLILKKTLISSIMIQTKYADILSGAIWGGGGADNILD